MKRSLVNYKEMEKNNLNAMFNNGATKKVLTPFILKLQNEITKASVNKPAGGNGNTNASATGGPSKTPGAGGAAPGNNGKGGGAPTKTGAGGAAPGNNGVVLLKLVLVVLLLVLGVVLLLKLVLVLLVTMVKGMVLKLIPKPNSQTSLLLMTNS